jgi:hypothetical protein
MAGLVALGLGLWLVYGALVEPTPPDLIRGVARLELRGVPVAGRRLEGRIVLLESVDMGEKYQVTLVCGERYRDSMDEKDRVRTVSRDEVFVDAAPSGDQLVLPFKFDVPIGARGSDTARYGHQWTLELIRAKGWLGWRGGFAIDVAAASEDEVRAFNDAQSTEVQGQVNSIEAELGKGPLTPRERAQLGALAPEERRQAQQGIEQIEKLKDSVMKKMTSVFIGGLMIAVALVFCAMVLAFALR